MTINTDYSGIATADEVNITITPCISGLHLSCVNKQWVCRQRDQWPTLFNNSYFLKAGVIDKLLVTLP